MKVLRYQAHNILKVSDIDWTLDGHHLFLVGGKNDQGKTSALTAFLMALCGRSGMDWPEVSLKEGQSEGWVKIHMESDDAAQMHVELYLRKSRGGHVVEKFRVLDSANHEVSEPRKLLQRLCAMRAFDPLEFGRLNRKEKKAVLQKVVGLDFAEDEAEHTRLYQERTIVNREVKALSAQADAISPHSDVPADEVSVTDFIAERKRRQAIGDINDTERRQLDGFARLVMRKELEVTVAGKKLELAEQSVSDARAHRAAQQSKVDGMAEPNLTEIDEQIEKAEETNRKVRENNARSTAVGELGKSEQKSQSLSNQMDAIRTAQQAALEKAKWPIEGLSFDDDGVIYNGFPFEQASKSQRVFASVKIGMALNPKLRVLVCQDGNDLDSESLAALQEMLEENDFQMIVEMVTRGDEDDARCTVIIEDGQQVE